MHTARPNDLPDDVREAIEAIVIYNWQSEEADCTRMEREGFPVDGHIFHNLTTVARWLDDLGE